MAQRNDGGPQHEIPDNGDPLLVRPFLTGEPGTSDAAPSQERWPAEKHRTIRSHRAGAPGHDAPPMLEAPAEHGPQSPDGPGQGRRRLHVAATDHVAAPDIDPPPAPAGPGDPARLGDPARAGDPAGTGEASVDAGAGIGAAVWLGGSVTAPPRPGRTNVAPVWRAETSVAPARPALDDPATGAPAQPGLDDPATGAPERAGADPAGPPRQPVPAGRDRRRSYALAGASAAAVLGLAAIGYGMFPATDNQEASLPSGALPPQVTASGPSAAGGATPGAPGRSAAADPGTAPGAATGPAPGTAPGATSGVTGATPPGTAATGPGGTTPATGVLEPAQPEAAAPTSVEPVPSVARVGPIASDSDMCLDVNGGVPADDNHVQVDNCNGTSAQKWTLATDGTLQAVGKCAQVTGDATVHIIGCDDRDEAQWRAGQDDSLVNVATNQCLTDPANGDRSGAGVVVSACTGGDNQQWELP